MKVSLPDKRGGKKRALFGGGRSFPLSEDTAAWEQKGGAPVGGGKGVQRGENLINP